ncbi:MAG: glycosyltransferase family 4 protein [Acidobacteria bacterium]|nr:glycosyltransferase family 4 protein [Acidobacteriota bacterium]
MTALRMLALSPVPEEGAGCRFRIAQYMPSLAAAGIEVTLSPFYTTEFFRLVYQKGRSLRKAALFLERAFERVRTLAERGRYDAIFIYREAFPIGPALIEAALARAPRTAVVYDFDDAIYLPNTSEANRAIAVLKWPGKVRSIVQRSHAVIAGNGYLAAYARAFNPHVAIIPTVVDTDLFVPRAGAVAAAGAPEPSPPLVGWIGTPTTARYLAAIGPALQELARTHPFVLRICGAGADVDVPGVRVENVRWTLENEVALFNTCDIGVYPLPDDEWARGKCGFKAIQFMACGVPVVASPVGVNRDIIQDGVSGLLAPAAADWTTQLGRLIADPQARRAIGRAGRRAIEARYSLRGTAPRLVEVVVEAVERARQPAAARLQSAGVSR